MRIISAIAPVVLFLAALMWYHFFYPPNVLKRASGNALMEFSQAVESQDKAKVQAALQEMLTDDAKIRLEVSFSALINGNAPPVVQEFSKASFIPFVDNLLYSLTDYHFEPELTRFELAEDRATAQVSFAFRQWADGTSHFSGLPVEMRFTAQGECTGKIMLTGNKPRLAEAVCPFPLHSVPKPGQENKLRSPEALQQLLKQER